MAKLSIQVGATSVTTNVFIQNSSLTTGAGLTGLVFNTASLTAYYALPQAASVQITLATLSAVTSAYSSGGFKEIDATNMPGWYRFDVPNAAIAAGRFVSVHLQGATNMAPCPLEIELTGWDNQAQLTVDKGTALSGYTFPMFDSGTGLPRTGLAPLVQHSIDGAAFANCTNTPATELANGFYTINLSAADLTGRFIALRFSATGALDGSDRIITQGN